MWSYKKYKLLTFQESEMSDNFSYVILATNIFHFPFLIILKQILRR